MVLFVKLKGESTHNTYKPCMISNKGILNMNTRLKSNNPNHTTSFHTIVNLAQNENQGDQESRKRENIQTLPNPINRVNQTERT